MGRKNRSGGPRPAPMFRIPAVDLTRPRPDFLAQFFTQPIVYGTPATSTLPLPIMPTINPQPQMPSPLNIAPFNTPTTLPPQKTINDVTNRREMIKLFIINGYHPIPVDDPPSLFNEILASKVGLIGANQIGHVICRGQPDYETFFCGMCEYWGTPSEMLTHLEDADHQLKYMQKFFKEKHRKVIVARSRDREALKKKLAMEISKAESDKKVVRRLNTILTVNILFQCWPNFLSHFNNSWKILDDDVKEVQTIITLDPPPFQSASTSSMLEKHPSAEKNIDFEEEDKPNIDEMDLCVCALVFIRAQAITKKGIIVEQIEKICNVLGASPELVFSDSVLGYAGIKIGSVETLVAIAKYYTNPLYKLSELLRKFVRSEPPLEPPQLLLELGVEKEKAAKMVRDVAMIDYTPGNNAVLKYPPRRLQNFVQDVYTDDMGRKQISYDGDYIEDNESYNDFYQPKRRKEE